MKIKTKSEKELHKEGWRFCRTGLYLGERITDATTLHLNHYRKYILDGTFECVDYSLTHGSGPRFTVIDKLGYERLVPWYIVKGELPNREAFSKIVVKKTFKGMGTAKYYPTLKIMRFDDYNFWNKKSVRQLREVARWILKVTDK